MTSVRFLTTSKYEVRSSARQLDFVDKRFSLSLVCWYQDIRFYFRRVLGTHQQLSDLNLLERIYVIVSRQDRNMLGQSYDEAPTTRCVWPTQRFVLNWGILEDEHTRMSDAGVPLATRVEGIPLDSEVLGEGLMRSAYFVESMKRGVAVLHAESRCFEGAIVD
ncbi:hypothetical protein SISNIDRAFT_471474 [Sistotremastrum niveocremeum HHB9708]|uniref:Uncharacterized protein n=1 Tax=Sistotremastrum niveocremeum HHB9708 TaxID=1314777 RepID=A0A164MKK4_9AGAM|nr:hypothetical protein SISNIDRAFT_471474 [Sistotremastrum niveocremeum HHB9708]